MFLAIALPSLCLGSLYLYKQYRNWSHKPKTYNVNQLKGQFTVLLTGADSKGLYNKITELGDNLNQNNINLLSSFFKVEVQEQAKNFINNYGIKFTKNLFHDILVCEDDEFCKQYENILFEDKGPVVSLPYSKQIIGLSMFLGGVADNFILLYTRIICFIKFGVIPNNLEGFQIRDIIICHGLEAIKVLKDAGVDLDKLEGFQIRDIIICHGLEVIKILKDARVELNKLEGVQIKEIIISKGLDSINILQEVGVELNKLEVFQIKDITNSHGLEAINALKAAGVDLENPYRATETVTNRVFDGSILDQKISSAIPAGKITGRIELSTFKETNQNDNENTEQNIIGENSALNEIIPE